MKVLLVAPRHSDLTSVDAEVQDILRSGLTVTPLVGTVTATSLLREARSGDYDVLWLASHGGEYVVGSGQLIRDARLVNGPGMESTDYGVLLSDGMMPMSELTALVRSRFRLVVLNTCDSLIIAQQLQVEANSAVICTVTDVSDRQAYQTGSNFAAHLADTNNIATAYELSIPGGNRTYLYLAALRPGPSAIEHIAVQLDELNKRLARELLMWRWLFGGSAVLHLAELTFIGWLMWTRGG